MNCECEDHYYEVTFSSPNKSALNELTQFNSIAFELLEENVITSENIVERCDHGDVFDCEYCTEKGGDDDSGT